MKGLTTFQWIIVLVVGLLVVGPYFGINLLPSGLFQQQTQQPGQTIVRSGPGFATATLTGNFIDAMTGATPNINVEVWSTSPVEEQKISVANCAAASCSVSTAAPTSLTGYVIAGNDNLLAPAPSSWTDRGDEYYLRKVSLSYADKGTPSIADPSGGAVKMYQEGAATFNGFDNGALESTLNVSVGSGATVDTTEIQMVSAANACLGNVDFDGNAPLMFVVNVSRTASLAVWDEARPINYAVSAPSAVPQNASADTTVLNGRGWVLPFNAVCDRVPGHDSTVKFAIRLKAAAGQNPASANPDDLTACIWDKTWYKGDDGLWRAGYEKPRVGLAAWDIGASSKAGGNCITISVS